MPRTIKKVRKQMRDNLREHRKREKARAEFVAAFISEAPAGIGQHVRFGIEYEDGEMRAVINLDDVGAKYVNDFAARHVIANPMEVVEQLAIAAGRKFQRGDFQQEGADGN